MTMLTNVRRLRKDCQTRRRLAELIGILIARSDGPWVVGLFATRLFSSQRYCYLPVRSNLSLLLGLAGSGKVSVIHPGIRFLLQRIHSAIDLLLPESILNSWGDALQFLDLV